MRKRLFTSQEDHNNLDRILTEELNDNLLEESVPAQEDNHDRLTVEAEKTPAKKVR